MIDEATSENNSSQIVNNQNLPVFMHKGQFSGYGSEHPVDKALGLSRAARQLASIAKGASQSKSTHLGVASELIKSGRTV